VDLVPIDVAAATLPHSVVFSDVDGVFRNPQSDQLSRAARACARLQRDGVALVLCSSKTRAELEQIQRDLGLRQPFIAEAGAAVFVPKGYFVRELPGARDIAGYAIREFGPPYATIVRALRTTAQRLGISVIGFNDMSVEDIAMEWRVPLLRARLAKLREYVEPFKVCESDPHAPDRLARALESAGLHCLHRGGLSYLSGARTPTGAMTWLNGVYRSGQPSLLTIGLLGVTNGSTLVSQVMREAFVLDDHRSGCAVDIHGWAEGIVDLVQEMKKRPAAALRN
jgi:mannosyl-3-phosphoglycerate phosphatase family protein